MNKQGSGKIEYLDYTFNPITGCLHGCPYCFAEKIANRFGGGNSDDALHYLGEPIYKRTKAGKMMVDPYPFGFGPTFHRYRLDEPQLKKQPSIIGVVFMGDIGGKWIPQAWFNEVMDACFNANWHTYVFLTKDPESIGKLLVEWAWNKDCKWRGALKEFIKNLWLGVTVTCQSDTSKVSALLQIQGVHKFLSIEPMLDWIDIDPHWVDKDRYVDMPMLDWVILGAESGNRKDKVAPKREWIDNIVYQCRVAGVPLFIKPPLYERFPIQQWPEGLRRAMER